MKRMTYRGIQNGQERVSHVKKENIPEVRVQFVEYRDALMQILASLDRDKNSNVASVLVLLREESEKWFTVKLWFVTKITNRACRWGETYGRTLFCYEDYQLSLWVRRDLWSDLFYFFFDDQLDLPVKETDRLYWCIWDFHLWQEGSESYLKTFLLQ